LTYLPGAFAEDLVAYVKQVYARYAYYTMIFVDWDVYCLYPGYASFGIYKGL
jgi:hypothetical protein